MEYNFSSEQIYNSAIYLCAITLEGYNLKVEVEIKINFKKADREGILKDNAKPLLSKHNTLE